MLVGLILFRVDFEIIVTTGLLNSIHIASSSLLRHSLPCHRHGETHLAPGERGGSVVECRTPEREVRGSRPTAAVLCP